MKGLTKKFIMECFGGLSKIGNNETSRNNNFLKFDDSTFINISNGKY